jgi:hypothetical protein
LPCRLCADVITKLSNCQLITVVAVLLYCPFGYAQVDFIAVSFVRTADVITNLRNWLSSCQLVIILAVLPCCPRAYAQEDFIAVSFVRTADVITNLRNGLSPPSVCRNACRAALLPTRICARGLHCCVVCAHR